MKERSLQIPSMEPLVGFGCGWISQVIVGSGRGGDPMGMVPFIFRASKTPLVLTGFLTSF